MREAVDTVNDEHELELVATLHERARTDDGLGPGVLLREAVSVRGPVTLSYNVNDESRE